MLQYLRDPLNVIQKELKLYFLIAITGLLTFTNASENNPKLCKLLLHPQKIIENFSRVCSRANIQLPYAYWTEICERPELPESIRSQVFDALGRTTKLFSGIQKVFPELITKVHDHIHHGNPSAAANTNQRFRWIELGSGGGETVHWINSLLDLKNLDFEYLLTDLYPQPNLWQEKIKKLDKGHQKKVNFINHEISFTNFADELTVLPTSSSQNPNIDPTNIILVVSAFHHLPDKHLINFFTQAKKLKAHIVVLEPLERDLKSLFISTAATVPSLLMPVLPAHSGADLNLMTELNNRLKLALTHWVFPIVPFIFLHDGVVSVLRQRTKKDFEHFFSQASPVIENQSLDKFYTIVNDHDLENMGTFKNFNAKLFLYKSPQ